MSVTSAENLQSILCGLQNWEWVVGFLSLASNAHGACFVGEDKFGKRFDDLDGFEADGDNLADEAEDILGIVGTIGVVGDAGDSSRSFNVKVDSSTRGRYIQGTCVSNSSLLISSLASEVCDWRLKEPAVAAYSPASGTNSRNSRYVVL